MADADVKIRYEFIPAESSIKAGADKLVKEYEKRFRKINIGGSATGEGNALENVAKKIEKPMKKMEKSFDTFDYAINILRATQEKTSLQTKLSSAQKVLSPILEPIQSTMERFKLIQAREPAISPTGIGQGEGGENIGQVAAGGGMMGALGTIAALLIVIAVAMTLISAFFDAVGPIIKVVMKMFSAMILILLMPFLKRGLPVLFGILKWMIKMSQGIADFADKFMTYMENLFGRAVAGDPMAIVELIIGPIGMLGIFLAKKLVEFLAAVDWNSIVNSITPLLEAAFAMVSEAINAFGIAVFGEETWMQIKKAIAFIQTVLAPEGLWENIKKAIDYIGKEVFGEGVWEKIKTAITDVNTLITDEWTNIIQTLIDVGNALKPIAGMFQAIKPSVGVGSAVSKTSGFGTGLVAGIGHAVGSALGLGGGMFGDFISRPGGGIQSFSSSDTIIGTKNPGAIGGVNITNNLTVSAGVDKNEFKKLLTEFSRQQARDLRTRTSYYGG